ncbi:lactonase family protein [Sabulilitoribacter arenilitoris]|uniref:Lactonase family protein n=1 Tax=Wocania arenilitoris TaxID=2044858 RepID=A0AAE3JM76_9FLAO|nr:lactonase family protein [Wocania arenilitoris]MCF7567486.1 lactonase family protein [Wocania arenilitoris]
MKFKIYLILISMSLFSCTTQNSILYVGTYTNGDSEGIYSFQFNTETGELSNKQLAASTDNPSFITFSEDRKYLYAVGEGKTGAVSAFKVGNENNLELINTADSNGGAPCHISINKNRAVVSNYSGGTVSIYSINSDGSLNEASQVFNHNSDSIASHAHSAQFYKDQLYVSDLGRNGVYNYKLENDAYKLVDSSILNMTEKAGPRHFSLTKGGQFIYIINEYANTITSGKKAAGGFELLQNISTLADDFKAKSYCADIHLSDDERFLYGSNRGENSIAVFKRNTNSGKLEKIQNISVHGDWPRNFTIDPSGKFLLVANQKSSNISVFKIKKETGKLSFLHDIKTDTPVCLLF